MSVIVRDMEMPEGCCECLFHQTAWDLLSGFMVDTTLCKATGKTQIVMGKERMKSCPLFECHDWREL